MGRLSIEGSCKDPVLLTSLGSDLLEECLSEYTEVSHFHHPSSDTWITNLMQALRGEECQTFGFSRIVGV